MKASVANAIIFMVVVLLGLTQAPAHPVLQEAERLAFAGATAEAMTEYERYLFFNPDSPAVAVYRAIAGLYRFEGRLSDAQNALQSALSSADCDSVRDAVRIEKSVVSLAQGNYQSAEVELLSIATFSGTAGLRDRANLFLCIAHVFAGEWEAAKRISAVASSGTGEGRWRLLDSLLGTAPMRMRKSPFAAKWMSTVLPGLGQAYSHDLSGGLNALAISATTGFMTVHSLFFGYYQEAIFTDITLFWRYYSGNRWHASEAAARFNEKRDRVIRKRIMEALSREE